MAFAFIMILLGGEILSTVNQQIEFDYCWKGFWRFF